MNDWLNSLEINENKNKNQQSKSSKTHAQINLGIKMCSRYIRMRKREHCTPMLLLIGSVFALLGMTEAQSEGDPCQVKGHRGICTESSRCVDLPLIMSQLGLGMRDVSRCGFTTYEEIICCPLSPSIPTTTIRTRSDDRPAVRACAEIDAELQPLLTPHILGGTPVELGEYPHMVAIGLSTTDDDIEYNCGGTLIAKRFVLTAAHCLVTRQKPVTVRMGVVNFTDTEQMKDVVEIRIKKIHVHPEYSSASVYNDIGLLELESDVVYTTNVYPTCLYTEPEDPSASSVLYVSGWGVINKRTREKSNILLKARQTIVENQRCNESYVDNGLTRRISVGIISSQMCAHDPGLTKDACQGDSGGPLILVVDEALSKFRVVGVISAGFSCGSTTPGLYTRVSAFLDYIESVAWPSG
ncbi:PREDICTED: serine protease persephone-like isoform X2 [Rhagoletis zephyria]|uniref:serine protease persephone-like isoform X2 n=2 Tax=Rhagoletis zephyria TaxID=28612 RepID=UPI0008112F6E|nr:PREDICTED: serine protease persephone-like isoform X2 [Rhagoletis zephyria]